MLKFEITTYTGETTEHRAIQLAWEEVEKVLGHKHRGWPEDDEKLIEALLEAGAPEWVRDAEGWIDEHGWGLIGPAV